MTDNQHFSPKFLWGASSFSWQIEGKSSGDAKLEDSIWHQFLKGKKRGEQEDSDYGEKACEHYQRFVSDVDLMGEKGLGLNSYRFSLSWPRILPQGRGDVSAKGLNFYLSLVDQLLHSGITPFVTLFDWDYPLALHKKGGWAHPDSPMWFAEYTQKVAKALKESVPYWLTFYAPNLFVPGGYATGMMAPGEIRPFSECVKIHRHVLLAQGLALQVLRSECPKALVGHSLALDPSVPTWDNEGEKSEQIAGAREHTFIFDDSQNELKHPTHPLSKVAWWSDPLFNFKGVSDQGESLLLGLSDNEQKIIQGPIDFLAVKMEGGIRVHSVPGTHNRRSVLPCPLKRGYAQTANGRELLPETLYWGSKFLWERYQIPLIISDWGLESTNDWVALDGEIHDAARVDFLQRGVLQLKRIRDEGILLKGFFVHSFLDGFDFAKGYRTRNGLIYVDFSTQKRILKDSAKWYQNFLRQR